MKSSRRISTNDEVWATMEANGQVLAHISKRNFSTVDDVIRLVSALAGQFFGLAKLTVRNRTQGWSMNIPVAGRHKLSFALGNSTPAPHDGLQYCIPW